MQIKTLSSAGLQPFGSILSERPKDTEYPYVLHKTFSLHAPVEQLISEEPVILDYLSGMSLLVIFCEASEDIYYLDRTVLLRPGVSFSIVALTDGCSAELYLSRREALTVSRTLPASAFERAASDLKFGRLYTFFYQECSRDFYFRGERHETYELVYVDHGQLHNLVAGKDILLRQQQLMLIDRDDWHTQYSDLPVSFLTVSFQVQNDALSALTGKVFCPSSRQRWLIQQMLEETAQNDYAYDCVESLLKLLLVQLLRSGYQPSATPVTQFPATRHAEHEIVDRLIQHISENIDRKLTLQALAGSAHISVSYMHRLFQQHLGMAPGQYIAKIRMEECKLLLREGALSMGEISKKMCFSSQQHFSSQFRRLCGMTPSEYVRTLR